MSSAFINGLSYESSIAQRLTSLYWSANKSPVRLVQPTAGATHANDIQIVPADASGSSPICVEVKTAGAFEAGQRAMKLSQCRTRLVLPKGRHNDLHRYCLPVDFRPFKGRIPSFLLGDKSLKTWNAEKRHFQSEYISIPDRDVIARYYKHKGCHYIQLERCGLFHTGDDPCEFGVPLFTCRTRLRVRCKQHSRNPVPSSVTCALEICDKNRLLASPYCLEERLPPGLTETAASAAPSTSASTSGLFYSDSDSYVSDAITSLFGRPGDRRDETYDRPRRLEKASNE